MNVAILSEIFARAVVSGEPDIATCASAIIEYRFLIDATIKELKYVTAKVENNEKLWALTRLTALTKTLQEYGTLKL